MLASKSASSSGSGPEASPSSALDSYSTSLATATPLKKSVRGRSFSSAAMPSAAGGVGTLLITTASPLRTPSSRSVVSNPGHNLSIIKPTDVEDSPRSLPSIAHVDDRFYILGKDITLCVPEGKSLEELSYDVTSDKQVILYIYSIYDVPLSVDSDVTVDNVNVDRFSEGSSHKVLEDEINITELFTLADIAQLVHLKQNHGEWGMLSPKSPDPRLPSTIAAAGDSIRSHSAGLTHHLTESIELELTEPQKAILKGLCSLAKYLYKVSLLTRSSAFELPVDSDLVPEFLNVLTLLRSGRRPVNNIVPYCLFTNEYYSNLRLLFNNLSGLNKEDLIAAVTAFVFQVNNGESPEDIYIQFIILERQAEILNRLRFAFLEALESEDEKINDNRTPLEWARCALVELFHKVVRYIYAKGLDNIDFYRFHDFANLLAALADMQALPTMYPTIIAGGWYPDEYITIRKLIEAKVAGLVSIASAAALKEAVNEAEKDTKRRGLSSTRSSKELSNLIHALNQMKSFLRIKAAGINLYNLSSITLCQSDFADLVNALKHEKKLPEINPVIVAGGEYNSYISYRTEILRCVVALAEAISTQNLKKAVITFFHEIERDRTPESKFIYRALCRIKNTEIDALVDALQDIFRYFEDVDFSQLSV